MRDIQILAREMKLASPAMAATTRAVRDAALGSVAEALAANREAIFAANREDLAAAAEQALPDAIVKRLKFDEGKLADVISGIEQLISLEDPIGKVLLKRELDTGLVLTRMSCPIGVIGVIFEARPDALVQISTLCIKSGNCAILKGGKETTQTNRALFAVIHDAAVSAGLPEACLAQAEAHAEIDALLACDREVDLLIPRGSNAFVQYIMDHTKIPVMGHADGVCHVYVDEACDQEMAIRVVTDAKTQYTAACNAAETLLVHRAIAADFLPKLGAALRAAGVKLRGTAEAAEILDEQKMSGTENAIGDETVQRGAGATEIMQEEDFSTEYLDMILSVKLVADADEAIDHINRFGSHHTDAILTQDQAVADHFMQMVDSAGVYHNCSTRFADGFRYGFGAEVGISTGKLHARGPVGLDGLVTYKYQLAGSGQIVADYASGKASFHFRDL